MSKLDVSRRSFLKVGAAAGIAGAVGVAASSKVPGVAAVAKGASPEFDNTTDFVKTNPPAPRFDLKLETKKYKWEVATKFEYTPSAKGRECKLVESRNRGGGIVKYVEHNENWLGTTQIVGEIKPRDNFYEGFHTFYIPREDGSGLMLQGDDVTIKDKFNETTPLVSSVYNVRNTLLNASDSVAKSEIVTPIPDPEQMSCHLKDFAYAYGATDIGIGKTPEAAIFSHLIDYYTPTPTRVENTKWPWMPYCITVSSASKDIRTMMANKGDQESSLLSQTISTPTSMFIGQVLCSYIRKLGYNAYTASKETDGERVLIPACLIASGYGELARGGITLSPLEGLKGVPSVIITDMPLAPDKPIDVGIIDFCRVCKKCAENCPSQAIPYDVEPSEHNGYLSWATDINKCQEYCMKSRKGHGCCSNCKRVCPWSSKEDSWFHSAGVWLGSSSELGSTILKSIDDMFGYGTEAMPQYEWWITWPEMYEF